MQIKFCRNKKTALIGVIALISIGAAFGQQAADKEAVITRATPNSATAQTNKPEQATTILTAHTIRTTRYSLTGNREGRVSFGDFQKQVYNHFQMDADKWVREVFVLDDGKTVGASQADHTVFWDATTGKETGRVAQRVYGFAHTGREFFTRSADGKFWLYSYPQFKRLRQIITHTNRGVEAFLFSPNDRYLAMKVESARPESEETYPYPHNSNKNSVSTNIYDMKTGEEVSSESTYQFHNMGIFSPDSRYYDVDETITLRSGVVSGVWRYDLTTLKVSKIGEHKG